MDIQNIVNQAVAIAQQESARYFTEQLQGQDQFACGFAWVDVYVDRTNSKIAKELLSIGFRKDYVPKRLCFWKPGAYNGQSMTVLEVGARAYADVLQKYGFRAYAGSRAD